jgi:hypothetical protein
MTGLDGWLKQATRQLSRDSAAQVRTEIQEHYEASRDAAITDGATTDEADRLALHALGDAKAANCQYRHVLLTSTEARMLRDGNWEAQVVCSSPWLKWLLLALPVAAVAAATALLLSGQVAAARDVLIAGIGMSPLFAALFLPIDTPSRGRVFRCVKWVAMTGALLLLFGPEALKWSWLPISCLWPLAWTEWTRASIRRKTADRGVAQALVLLTQLSRGGFRLFFRQRSAA